MVIAVAGEGARGRGVLVLFVASLVQASLWRLQDLY